MHELHSQKMMQTTVAFVFVVFAFLMTDQRML